MTEMQTVSRKTPLDGRLEISLAFAARLSALETPLTLAWGAGRDAARLREMSCSCGKTTSEGLHVHRFIECELLRGLPPGSLVRLELDERDATVVVSGP